MTTAPAAEPHATPATRSARLRQEIERAGGPFGAACTALVNHPHIRELWPEYLVRQHQIIRATVPLTEAALERARSLPSSDPLRDPLTDYLTEHVDEELGHDDVLLDDLAVLGLSRAEVLGRTPSPAVATLVGCQYYWIYHHHPLAFLGFVAQMEGYPPTPELNALLMERTGYPVEAFQIFIQHAELDPGHRDHLDRFLNSLPLTPEHESMLAVSATTTMILAARPIEEVLDHLPGLRSRPVHPRDPAEAPRERRGGSSRAWLRLAL